MARTRMITRTVKTNQYTALVVDLHTREVKEELFCIDSADSMKKEDIEKTLRNKAEGMGYALATVLKVEQIEAVWGMPETEFMKYAIPVDR